MKLLQVIQERSLTRVGGVQRVEIDVRIIAATAATEGIFDSFLGEPEEMKHLVQVNTYGGHPIACAAGLENVRLMEEENLPGRAAEIGAHLLEGLKSLKKKHPVIGDVRGKVLGEIA